MSGSEENFLLRWSRRKRDAVVTPDQAPADPVQKAPDSDAGPPPTGDSEPFDIASLPPVESIEAGTDISAFLRAGVPEALKRAALRRVWVTDPAIRDFKGLQEYDWDFNTPGAIPGFESIGPDIDVKTMAEQILGGGKASPAEPSVPEQSRISGTPPSADISESSSSSAAAAPPPDATVHSIRQSTPDAGIGASQQEDRAPTEDIEEEIIEKNVTTKVRRHGSALPS